MIPEAISVFSQLLLMGTIDAMKIRVVHKIMGKNEMVSRDLGSAVKILQIEWYA